MLVTRPRDLAAAFVADLESRGAIALVTPVIAILPPDDPGPLRDALLRLHEFDWCAFTSANGVNAFVSAFETPAHAAGALQPLRVAAVGSVTAERLARDHISVAAVPSEFFGESLAHAIAAQARPGARVLIVRAQEGRDALPDSLRTAGLRPHVVAAYRTAFVTSTDFEPNAREADVITFASSSAVAGFVAAAGGTGGARALTESKIVACIGPLAANAARKAGLRVDVMPTRYTGRDMIDALSAHFAARP